MKTLAFSGFLLWSFTLSLSAQGLQPVSWRFSAEAAPEAGQYDLILTAAIDPGWAVYSQTLGSDDGPIPTTVSFIPAADAYQTVGNTREEGNKKEAFDPVFQMQVAKYEREVRFIQRITVTEELDQVSGWVEFMCCDEEKCLPPTVVEFTIPLPH